MLKEFYFIARFLMKVSNIELPGNPSSGSRADTCGKKDRQTDKTKVTDSLDDYARALLNPFP
jgi:hypothetical protein